MKLTVLAEFRDRDNYTKVYGVGQVIDLEEVRAAHLIKVGVCEAVVEKPVVKEEPAVASPAPEAPEVKEPELVMEADTAKEDAPKETKRVGRAKAEK